MIVTAALALSGALVPAQSAAAGVYACAVSAFLTTSSDDAAFVAGNTDKRFEVTVGAADLVITSRSEQFTDATKTYRIVMRDVMFVAARSESAFATDTAVLPARAANPQASAAFEMSIALQAPSFTNVWLLDCAPARAD
ncbi:MAG: hypothetical protein AAF677_13370 [Pseudomonadota bacterium]